MRLTDSKDDRRWRQAGATVLAALPSTAFLAAAFILPAILFGLVAWDNHRETLNQAASRVERTTRVLEEHAVKVLETNRLVVEQVKQRIRTVDWSSESDQVDLHKLLDDLQTEFDQVTTIAVTDAEGHLRASGRTYPVDRTVSFKDRDWFAAVSQSPSRSLFISRSYKGRQSGLPIFNLAVPVFKGAGVFDGVIAESIDRTYFERFYRDVEPEFDHAVTLLREDGEILASEPPAILTSLPLDGPTMTAIRRVPFGSFMLNSRLDHVDRLYAYRKVGSYPLYVRFGISVEAALAPWRRNLFTYGIVATLASIVLAIVSLFAAQQTWKERDASRRWREAAAELERRAVERERVEDQLRQLQKMEAIGRLTGGIAHDFNNLLTVVIGNLELTQRAVVGNGPRAGRLIAQAMDGAIRAAALTHRLLAFSRQQPLQPKPVQAGRLIAGMEDLLRVTLGETVTLDTVLPDDLWLVLADPNQLESALLNLVVNSRDAMPDGGRLKIEGSNVTLDPDYAVHHPNVVTGPYLRIAVSDTGSGIPAHVLAKVFEPFFTTKPIGKGTGLGLSQVYGFAQQSGGHVAIRSEEGRGTSIDLYLPKSTRVIDDRREAPREAARPASSRGETILVVEDEDIVRRFTTEALLGEGYVVHEAADGASALEKLRAYPEITMLFTDVILKGKMNGRALAEQATEMRPDLPVLFTTGYTSDAVILGSDGGEPVNLLNKPFSAVDVATRIRPLLDTVADSIPATG